MPRPQKPHGSRRRRCPLKSLTALAVATVTTNAAATRCSGNDGSGARSDTRAARTWAALTRAALMRIQMSLSSATIGVGNVFTTRMLESLSARQAANHLLVRQLSNVPIKSILSLAKRRAQPTQIQLVHIHQVVECTRRGLLASAAFQLVEPLLDRNIVISIHLQSRAQSHRVPLLANGRLAGDGRTQDSTSVATVPSLERRLSRIAFTVALLPPLIIGLCAHGHAWAHISPRRTTITSRRQRRHIARVGLSLWCALLPEVQGNPVPMCTPPSHLDLHVPSHGRANLLRTAHRTPKFYSA